MIAGKLKPSKCDTRKIIALLAVFLALSCTIAYLSLGGLTFGTDQSKNVESECKWALVALALLGAGSIAATVWAGRKNPAYYLVVIPAMGCALLDFLRIVL